MLDPSSVSVVTIKSDRLIHILGSCRALLIKEYLSRSHCPEVDVKKLGSVRSTVVFGCGEKLCCLLLVESLVESSYCEWLTPVARSIAAA